MTDYIRHEKKSYRPLSRYISLYRSSANFAGNGSMLPSPLEVDRFISNIKLHKNGEKFESFRPLSRYIGLYPLDKKNNRGTVV